VEVLKEILGYLKKSLNLEGADVLTVDEALAKVEADTQGYNKMIVESSEPGSPAFEFRNV
jgi:leucyl-tRNA synthetase